MPPTQSQHTEEQKAICRAPTSFAPLFLAGSKSIINYLTTSLWYLGCLSNPESWCCLGDLAFQARKERCPSGMVHQRHWWFNSKVSCNLAAWPTLLWSRCVFKSMTCKLKLPKRLLKKEKKLKPKHSLLESQYRLVITIDRSAIELARTQRG